MNKRGAIELSMSTVVIVVMAIVLLSLGIVFIRGIMGKISGLSDQAFISADKSIQDLMGGDQEFFISGTSFEKKPGEKISIAGGIQNFMGKDMKFTLRVESADETSETDWIILPKSMSVKVGSKKGFPVEVRIPKTAMPGTTHMYEILAHDGEGKLYGSEVIAINVK